MIVLQGCAESILRHSTQLPLHFVLLTDTASVPVLGDIIRNMARIRAKVPVTVSPIFKISHDFSTTLRLR